jgi:hypothetical protein
MLVSELIEWLRTQDQGATVEVIEHEDSHSYYRQGGQAAPVVFDPAKHTEYTDMRGNAFAAGKPYENARTLLLGVHNG